MSTNHTEDTIFEATDKQKKSFFYRLEKSRHDRQSDPDIDFDTPVRNRYCTDVIGIVLLVSSLLILFGLVLYCVIYGDIDRIKNGVDSCGNVCGKRPLLFMKMPAAAEKNPLEGRSNEYGPLCSRNNEGKK